MGHAPRLPLRPALEHLPAALAVGLVAWGLSGRADTFLCALALGWLVDADHLFDLAMVLLERRQVASLAYCLGGLYFDQTPRLYILLHAWEWVPACGAALALAGRPDLGLAGAAALAAHLVQDHLTYPDMNPGGYFLTWRLVHGFDKRRFLSRLRS